MFVMVLGILLTLQPAWSSTQKQAKQKSTHKVTHVKTKPQAKTKATKRSTRAVATRPPLASPPPVAEPILTRDGEAEARLVEIYTLVGHGKTRDALARADKLVIDYPNFQLAQLVHGDLLSSQVRPVRMLGDVPDTVAQAGALTLANLREESQVRLKALRERPPAGTIPSQFVALSPANQHAIAVDASRSRLYLFENSRSGLKLVADYYVSVGKSGIEKTLEGDQRTPLGVYFITSSLDPNSLKEFYGLGALPINYPNPLDIKRGKTGSGIWLHGTPPDQFSRAPRASDGCVVLSNPDLERLLRTVRIRTTPVVIAQHLNWVRPDNVTKESRSFESYLSAWRLAKTGGDAEHVLGFYDPQFKSHDLTLAQWAPTLRKEVSRVRGRKIELKDVSYLRWTDTADTMVVTFGEVIQGMQSGPVKRQFWVRQGQHWKIFFEGVIG